MAKELELDTINRLFLELSQITTATTGKELKLQSENAELRRLLDAHVSTKKCANCGEQKPLPYRRDDLGGYVCLTCVERLLDKCFKGIADNRQAALELCWQIEKLPASEECTKTVVMASTIHAKLNDLLP